MTFEQLKATFAEFRDKVGQRRWMEDEDTRGALISALFWAVNNAQMTDAERALADRWWDAAFVDFSHRCLLVDCSRVVAPGAQVAQHTKNRH